jgi:hypothetical protein
MDDITQQYTKRTLPPWPALLGLALAAVVMLGGVATMIYGNVRAFTEQSAQPSAQRGALALNSQPAGNHARQPSREGGVGQGADATTATTAANPANPANPATGTVASDPQVIEGGNVKVVVQWQGARPANGSSPEGLFSITLDTHSVDLDGYSLDEVAVLHAASGEELRPTSWELPKGGHHRTGSMTFPVTDRLGNPLFAEPAQKIELVIHDVAGVEEQVFSWTP